MELADVIGLIGIIVAGIIAYVVTNRRRDAVAAVARKLGLRFRALANRDIVRRYHFLNKLHKGSDRYAFNILSGNYKEHDVILFDYHYQTGFGDNSQQHYLSFFILRLSTSFPELIICPEGILSKIANSIGFDDIDFESYEFSRRFCVRSQDKKFAYDVCNARMIDYLLSNDDLCIEIEGQAMAIYFDTRLSPEHIEPNLNRLIAIRSLMPDYLFLENFRFVWKSPPEQSGRETGG